MLHSLLPCWERWLLEGCINSYEMIRVNHLNLMYHIYLYFLRKQHVNPWFHFQVRKQIRPYLVDTKWKSLYDVVTGITATTSVCYAMVGFHVLHVKQTYDFFMWVSATTYCPCLCKKDINNGKWEIKLRYVNPHSAIPNHSAGSSVNSDCFWAYLSILAGFYNGGLWQNIFWSINK